MPAKVKGGRTVYNVTWGVPVILECTAEGEPPPEITWWENGVPVSTSLILIGRSTFPMHAF